MFECITSSVCICILILIAIISSSVLVIIFSACRGRRVQAWILYCARRVEESHHPPDRVSA